MKFKLLLLCVAFGLILSGCTGPRVQNNVYSIAGCDPYVVSSDMEYVGEAPVTFKGGCSGDYCSVLDKAPVRNVGDLFVRTVDGKVAEFLVVGYQRLGKGWQWMSPRGEVVDFDGKEYAEFFTSIKTGEGYDPYINLISQKGYTPREGMYAVRALNRNLSGTTNLYLWYGCSEDYIPSERERGDKKAFLRKKFGERVKVANNM